MVPPTLGPTETGQRRIEDRGLIEDSRLVRAELRANVVLVGQEAAARFAEYLQQRVTIEVDPDQAAGDAALVTAVRAWTGGAHRVDGGLSASRKKLFWLVLCATRSWEHEQKLRMQTHLRLLRR